MPTPDCPLEAALWPLAFGDSAPSDIARHAAGCPHCRVVIDELKRDAAALRALQAPAAPIAAPASLAAALAGRPATEASDSATVVAVAEAASPEEDPGDCDRRFIGRYPVSRLMGCGGQGAVYLGRHPDLDLDVVVKWAHAGSPGSERDRSQLQQEAHLLARIRHPHLARVLDVGIEEGRTFIVLEYVAGEDLRQACAGRPLPPQAAARIAAEIAAALGELHRHGVLHLDLKPENIVMDRERNPKLIDLGSAQFAGRGRALPSASAVHGTWDYMPPEQQVGNHELLSERTDVYGLGAVLYELLTGTPPRIEQLWGGGAATASSPWQHPAFGFRIPPGLWRICTRALHPDPQQRFPSAREMERALRRFLGRKTRRMIVAAMLLLCMVNLLLLPRWNFPRIADRTVPELSLTLEPAAAGGVSLQIACHTSPNFTATLYCILADGSLAPIAPVDVHVNRQQRSILAPAQGRRLTLPSGGPLLILASLEPLDAADDPAARIRRLRCPLPRLPSGASLRLTPDGCEPVGVNGLWSRASPDHGDLDRLRRELAAAFPAFEARLIALPE